MGLGFVLRDPLGDMVMASTHQMAGFNGSDIAKATACLFSLLHILSAKYSNLVMEGGSLSVVSKLVSFVIRRNQTPF